MLETKPSWVSDTTFYFGKAHSGTKYFLDIVEYKKNTMMGKQEYACPQENVLIDTHEGYVSSNRKMCCRRK